MSKYLDIKELGYNDNIIEVDDYIADAILEFNKKGYITYASCSGHSDIEFYTQCDPKEKKEKLVESGLIVFEEDDEMVYTLFPSISTYCYVKFNKGYNFVVVPNGFEYETANQAYNSYIEGIKVHPESKNDSIVFGDMITRRIDFMDENGKRRPKEIIEKEIIEVNNELLKWVKQLKPVNEIEETHKTK